MKSPMMLESPWRVCWALCDSPSFPTTVRTGLRESITHTGKSGTCLMSPIQRVPESGLKSKLSASHHSTITAFEDCLWLLPDVAPIHLHLPASLPLATTEFSCKTPCTKQDFYFSLSMMLFRIHQEVNPNTYSKVNERP